MKSIAWASPRFQPMQTPHSEEFNTEALFADSSLVPPLHGLFATSDISSFCAEFGIQFNPDLGVKVVVVSSDPSQFKQYFSEVVAVLGDDIIGYIDLENLAQVSLSPSVKLVRRYVPMVVSND